MIGKNTAHILCLSAKGEIKDKNCKFNNPFCKGAKENAVRNFCNKSTEESRKKHEEENEKDKKQILEKIQLLSEDKDKQINEIKN